MRNWFSRHPIWFMAFYLVFYLSVFHWLEVNITVPEVWVHCHLDDLIPFCKYAVIPYFAWFPWIPFTLFFLLWKAPREDFWRLCLPLFAGMTIALAVYVILPNGLDLRPYRVYGSDIFARIVRQLYSTDTATNVCPSIHVFNSVTLMLAYHRCRIFEQPRFRWMRPAADVLCISIVCSTMLLKQHSCIDVVMGILLAMAVDSAASSLERSEYRILQNP
ncbi:hypothetical protein ACNQFG_03550 [Faecalibacterium prausnitzii]|uniref:hypothetical protein n=1 Tax=Faecalibacterium prausnitzii TaxID=853 RepID=UPI003C2E2917